MKRKEISKISLSLLVAALFIFSAVGAIATTITKEEGEAGEVKDLTQPTTFRDMVKKPGDEPIGQEDPFCGVYVQGIEAFVTPDPPILIAPGLIDLDVALWYDPTCYHDYGPPVVKVFVEVYEQCCGEEVTMYETSFEDNFDIYNNWLQEDADCGVTKEGNTGFFDTWTWTDARASPECEGTHSMKNTMYDIYKGQQDDYLECTKSFDISDQQGINISFDIWVEGDYDIFWAFGWMDPDGVVRGKTAMTAFDYLDFEIGDDGGNWVNPDMWNNFHIPNDYMFFAGASEDSTTDGAYKFPDTSMQIYDPSPFRNYTPKALNLGGGWWHVWYEATTTLLDSKGLNVEDIQFRFSWHSDPEQQFEGAYVDCVKVVSIEDCEEKIFQTHTQGPVVLDPINPDIFYDEDHGDFYVRMPLQWPAEFIEKCGQKQSEYEFLVWIEVLNDPCTYWTPHDWPFPVDITVLVGEWSSCNVENLEIETSFEKDPIIPGDGIMIAGDDAHIMADVHLCGAVPYENLVVNAYAEAITHEELYYSSCDSSMGWTFGHFDCTDSLWHITDTDSWDAGGKSLACFDKDTNHYHNNMYVDYAENQKTFDMEEVLSLDLQYYAKWITAEAADYWLVMLTDPSLNYVLGNWPSQDGLFSPYGYHPDWIGPMQPMGEYRDFDMLEAYDYWYDIRGMFRLPDGSQEYELGFGFAMWGTDKQDYTHPVAEDNDIYWSGVYIDEVRVIADVIGDKVWEETAIIPGPMEPCDTEPVQFEWEDVPYSNYLITVECEEGCNNCGDPDQEAMILVISNKEKADDKEVESEDLTGIEGEWGISTSDENNYLASNPFSTTYSPNMNIVAQLCPEHDGDCDMHDVDDACCIDVSHLGAAPFGGQLLLDFSAWWDIEWWWDYCFLEITTTCKEPHPTHNEWIPVLAFSDGGLWESSEAWYNPSDTLTQDGFVVMSLLEQGGLISGYQGMLCQFPWWDVPGLLSLGEGVPCAPTGEIDLGLIITGTTGLDPTATQFGLRFRFMSDADPRCPEDGYGEFRGMKIDWLTITNMIYDDDVFPPETLDFEDEMDDMANWCTGMFQYGQYWEHSIDIAGDHVWCTDFPAAPVVDALIWTTEIKDCYEAYLSIETTFDFGTYSYGLVQIAELGSDQFYTLDKFGPDEFAGPLGFGSFITPDDVPYNLNYWIGKDVQIRFLAIGGHGTNVSSGEWCVKNLEIVGKQDHSAPTASITMSGTMKESGWYSTAVKVKITAEDEGSGVKEIHYILDGVETVVAGDVAEFTISGNGIHTIEYWSVDNVGNEGEHKTVQPFKIDSGTAPTVAITAPEPGIYLFGKKLLSSSNVFIIGAFTIEADADDADSGIYKVSFYLDDELMGEDTEAPFSQYVAIKHMGAGTIKVVAEDFAQNVAEDTLDIKYYKFF